MVLAHGTRKEKTKVSYPEEEAGVTRKNPLIEGRQAVTLPEAGPAVKVGESENWVGMQGDSGLREDVT